MDTGIHVQHPDLKENIKGGINLVGNPSDYSDDNGHGTHVAGIVGALNNDIGIVGVMPKVDLYAVKVFNSAGEGSLSDIIRGLQWCINNKIKLVNMSFGSATDNTTFREVFQNAEKAGVIMVVAAGNDGNEHKMQFPAKYPETIAVSSLNASNNISSFSSYGPEVDIIAPGRYSFYLERWRLQKDEWYLHGCAACYWSDCPDVKSLGGFDPGASAAVTQNNYPPTAAKE